MNSSSDIENNMLTPMGTKDEDEHPTASIDYYSNPQNYYYQQDFSQSQLTSSSFYDSNQFYSYPPISHRVHDEQTMYMPIYPHQSFVNDEILYPSVTNSYDCNLSTNYLQTTPTPTENPNGEFFVSYVSSTRNENEEKPSSIFFSVAIERCSSINNDRC